MYIPMPAYTGQSSCSENCETNPTSTRRHRYKVVANKSSCLQTSISALSSLLCEMRPLHDDITFDHCLTVSMAISIPAYGVSGVLYKAIETVASAYKQESLTFSSESLQNKPPNACAIPKKTEAQNVDSSPMVAKGIPCQHADKLQESVVQKVRVNIIKAEVPWESGNVLNISPEAPYRHTNVLRMIIEYAMGPKV